MDCNIFERAVQKGKSIAGIKPNGGVIIKSQKWIKDQSKVYEEATKRPLSFEIDSNIKEKAAYPNISRAIESAINEIMEKKENTFDNILVIKNPYQYSPLCAMALFETKKGYSVNVTVKGKTEDCDICYTVPAQKSHRVPIMGLYPDYTNTIELKLLNKRGRKVRKKTFQMDVAPLKGKSSTIKVNREVSKTEYLYGLTLVYGGDDGIYPYAFDRKGDIRFAFAMSPKTYGFQPISKGRFLFLNKKVTRLTFTNPASIQLFEVDQMGRFHKTYNIEKGTHHDFAELKNGNFVVGGNAVEGGTYEDTVLEIDRKTGNVLNEVRIKDYIDDKYVDTSDWAHLNSIDYNTEDKTVTVNLRNLHSVIKINYETKELLWILGHPTFWGNSTVSDKVLSVQDDNIEWFFQAHAAYYIPVSEEENSDVKYLLLYDNHTQKRVPVDYYDNGEKSYIRIYRIDEKEKTVSLYRSYPFENSKIRSNGLYEKEAGRIMAMNGKLTEKSKERCGSIIEFDYESAEVLNQYATNYGFYRAYQFQFEPEEMAQEMEVVPNYCLGNIEPMKACGRIDVSTAKKLPKPVLEDGYKTETERKEKLRSLAKKNPQYYVDPEQDMARITMTLEEDVLYVELLDHQLQQIYFVGKNETYIRDFSDTKQERPEYFARANHIEGIPLDSLKEDSYKIYYQHETGLYESGYWVDIKNK